MKKKKGKENGYLKVVVPVVVWLVHETVGTYFDEDVRDDQIHLEL